jgi:hypothetical protein
MKQLLLKKHQGTLFDDTKFQLQGILQLLDQDIDILVQVVGPILSIFAKVRDLLPPDLASVLTLVAYIEGFQPLVLEAKKRIADRAARQS